ncbi:MAG: hypothetical protein ABR586_01720 [Thermoplasmatota archaeon]
MIEPHADAHETPAPGDAAPGVVFGMPLGPGIANRVRIPFDTPAGATFTLSSIVIHNEGTTSFLVEGETGPLLAWNTSMTGQAEHRLIHLASAGRHWLELTTNLDFKVMAWLVFHPACPCTPFSPDLDLQPQVLAVPVHAGQRVEVSSASYKFAARGVTIPQASDWQQALPAVPNGNVTAAGLRARAQGDGFIIVFVGGIDLESVGDGGLPSSNLEVRLSLLGNPALSAKVLPLPAGLVPIMLLAAVARRRR